MWNNRRTNDKKEGKRHGGEAGEEDFYKTLGLPRTATADEIKASYRKLSVKWHPDKNPDKREEATAIFQKINAASKVLSNPKMKEVYDKHGHEGLEMFEKGIDPDQVQRGGFGFPFNVFGQGNPFSSPFGNPSGSPFGNPSGNPGNPGMRRPQKCKPSVFKLRLTLRELYDGGMYKLSYRYKQGCETCEGTGSASKKLETCNACKGGGTKVLKRQLGNGMIQMIEQECETCHGKGQHGDLKNVCQGCKGKTWTYKMKECDFPVYPGMQWKMQLGIEGSGDELYEQIPGDLVVIILPPKKKGITDDPTGSESDVDDEEDQDNTSAEMKDSWYKVLPGTSADTSAATPTAEQAAPAAEQAAPAAEQAAPTAEQVVKRQVDDDRKFDNVRVLSKPKRNGADLIYNFSIPLVNALTGLKYKIVHPGSGEVLVIDHPEVIEPGSVFIIPGKGMPELDQAAVAHRLPFDQLNTTYGRIIIEFKVIFPNKVNKKSAEVLQALLGKGLGFELPAELDEIEAAPTTAAVAVATKNQKGKAAKGKAPKATEAPTVLTPVRARIETPVTLVPVGKGSGVQDDDADDSEDDGQPKMMHAPQCAQQ